LIRYINFFEISLGTDSSIFIYYLLLNRARSTHTEIHENTHKKYYTKHNKILKQEKSKK